MISERARRFHFYAGFLSGLRGNPPTMARAGAPADVKAAFADGHAAGRERREAREHAESVPPCERTGIESDECDCIDQEDRRV
jgi:hypothetical protein